MPPRAPGFLDGVPLDGLAEVLGGLERRHFGAGVTILAEGDAPRGIHVIEAGLVDVFSTDRHNVQHHLSRLGPGATLGEMSVFTGQPTSAEARAATDTDVLIMNEADFRRAANVYPRLYWNLGAILSQRLASSNRRLSHDEINQTTVLLDDGAPPTLGYALACSVAWHIRAPTLLLVVDSQPSAELAALGAATPAADAAAIPERRAFLQVAQPEGHFALDTLAQTVDDLHGRYEHVLVQVHSGASVPELPGRRIRLAASEPGGSTLADSTIDHTIVAWSEIDSPPRANRNGVLRVPRLAAADAEAFATGVLSPSSPTGRALGWTARRTTGQSVGLALGAGGVWGYAHVGVLRALTRLGMPVDYVAGTSIGSAVAALCALGYDPDGIARVFDTAGRAAFRLAVPVRSILSSAGVRGWVRRVVGDIRIEELPLPLAVVAADILTEHEVVFREGPLWSALLASMSIPGIYPPVTIGRHMLVDGGTLNPVPSNVAAEMGAGVVIAVKLVNAPAAPGSQSQTTARTPFLLQTLLAAIWSMQGKITADTAATATVLIEVKFEKTGAERASLRTFASGRRYIGLGEAAAEAAFPRLAAALPWLKT